MTRDLLETTAALLSLAGVVYLLLLFPGSDLEITIARLAGFDDAIINLLQGKY